MNDLHKNIDGWISEKGLKVLIVFEDMIPDKISNNKLNYGLNRNIHQV